jgi:hypothetical protein
MPFKKNNNYGKGRPKGSGNKSSALIKKVLNETLEDYFANGKFISDLNELDAKERIDAISKITPYILPKLQSTTLDTGENTEELTITMTKKAD